MSVQGDISRSWHVRHVHSTGSTNDDLLAAAADGSALDRTVLRADHQESGRGRLDRRWDAPAGANLLASILFVDPPSTTSTLPQAVGRAALDAVESLAARPLHPRLGLKWPNDLMLDGKKLAGVLAQRSSVSGAIVVGIGLNVGWAPAGAAALVADLDLDVGPSALLDALLDHLDEILASGDVASRYRERLATLGARVRVDLPGGRSLEGTAIDLDDAGRLRVEYEQPTGASGVATLDVGDIVHLRSG